MSKSSGKTAAAASGGPPSQTPDQQLASIISEKLVKSLHPDTQTLDGAWIGQLMNQMGEVIDKSARILFKSLGGILALQDRLAEEWHAWRANPGAREVGERPAVEVERAEPVSPSGALAGGSLNM